MASTLGRGAGSALLVLAMAIGSVFMWIGVPVLWLYGASHLSSTSQPSMGVYFGVLVGIVVTMAAIGKVLGMLNRTHMALTGNVPAKREQTVWLKSMRADASETREHGILATVMVISVGIAGVLMGIWFLFFAHGTPMA